MEQTHAKKKTMFTKRKIRKILFGILCATMYVAIFATLTNPFSSFSMVTNGFTVTTTANEVNYTQTGHLAFSDNIFVRTLANAKSGWHILSNHVKGGGKQSKEHTIEAIIDGIHELRFDPKKPFLISGDHFVELYPRSLGIFYHTLLDPRTARSHSDWQRRQELYLKTTLYALETFKNTKYLSTTIIPVGPRAVTTANYFSPPSDTMYSLLFALATLQSTKELEERYPFTVSGDRYELNTSESAKKILTHYRDTLTRHYATYVSAVTDKTTGLIRKNISLSGTRDSVKRQSAFYDNIILWKTMSLAQQLGVTKRNQRQLDELKQKIITAFWLPGLGHFLDDLSPSARTNNNYSSDWLIAFMTGFLDPKNANDREYLTRGVQFISNRRLDRPLAVKYQPDTQLANLHLVLRLGAPSYGTQAVWSNWGMEYTKLLLRLYQETCNHAYLKEAEYQIKQYSEAIVKYKGYLELYSGSGKPFKSPMYTTIYQAGWVVTFEQARAMLKSIHGQELPACTRQNNAKIAF